MTVPQSRWLPSRILRLFLSSLSQFWLTWRLPTERRHLLQPWFLPRTVLLFSIFLFCWEYFVRLSSIWVFFLAQRLLRKRRRWSIWSLSSRSERREWLCSLAATSLRPLHQVNRQDDSAYLWYRSSLGAYLAHCTSTFAGTYHSPLSREWLLLSYCYYMGQLWFCRILLGWTFLHDCTLQSWHAEDQLFRFCPLFSHLSIDPPKCLYRILCLEYASQ